MIQCLVEKDIKTADELCEAVQDCKKELKHTQVGKHHKIMGAGGKTILLVGKREKEFVAYEDVMNKKGHFGKLLHKIFFEEVEEESEFSVEEVLLDLREKLSEEQIAELVNSIKLKNRVDFTEVFMRTNDFSEEFKETIDEFSDRIKNKDVLRAYALLSAIDVEFDPAPNSWETDNLLESYKMTQGDIRVRFITNRRLTIEAKEGFDKVDSSYILCRNEYGDILFKREGGKVRLVVLIESPF